MNTTANRLVWQRQGAAMTTALGATYPTGAPLADDAEAPSNTLGVFIPKRYIGEGIAVRVTATRTGGVDPQVALAVYGYIRSYLTAANPPVVTSLAQWDHIDSLFNGSAIGVDSQAIGGVNVISHTANGFVYNEFLPTVGGLYERILVLPVTITANTSVVVDIGLQKGG